MTKFLPSNAEQFSISPGTSVQDVISQLGIPTEEFHRWHQKRYHHHITGQLKACYFSSPRRGRRIEEINSAIEVSAHEEFLSEENALRLLGKPDVVVDCLDNIPTRFVLEKAVRKIGCPLVTAAVAGLSGHVSVVFPGYLGLEALYGPPEFVTFRGAEAKLGCLPQAVTLIASLQCSEVAKILLGQKYILKNQMLVVDLMDNTFEVLQLQ